MSHEVLGLRLVPSHQILYLLSMSEWHSALAPEAIGSPSTPSQDKSISLETMNPIDLNSLSLPRALTQTHTPKDKLPAYLSGSAI